MPQSSSRPALLYRRVPALDSLRRYTRADARADLLGGLSVAAVALPQAMAYALIAGLPPEHGLYTAIVMTAVGAVLDSSRQLINGPTNAISIALLSVTALEADPAQKVQVAVAMAFLIGVVQIAISLIRLGDLTRYISHSVIVGFTTGASLLLVMDQLKNLLGLKSVGDVDSHFLTRFWRSLTEGGPVHLPTLAVGLSSIALVLALRWFKRRINKPLLPELLIVVIIQAGVSAVLGLEAMGVRVIGDIPAHLPKAEIPVLSWTWIQAHGLSAFAIGLLGLLEAISMAKSIAATTHQKLDLNQQCLSEGVANLAGSFFGCMPGSGSLTRSAINQQAGARTQWSGVVSAVAVAVIMVAFASYARFIPRAALAGILMLTAARMVNFHDLRFHLRVSRFDKRIVLATAFSAIAISIEFCVLIGTFLSFALTVPRAGRMQMIEYIVETDGSIHERLATDEPCPKIRIFGLEGEFCFAAVDRLDQFVDHIEASVTPETRVVVLRMKGARNPDAVALTYLERVCEQLRGRGVDLVLGGVRTDLYQAMERCGLAEKIGETNIFREQPVRQTSTLQAVRFAYARITETCADCPRGGQPHAPLRYMV